MKTVTVYNTKGGVGKTTVSANLVSYWRGRDTLAIDTDAQYSLTGMLGGNSEDDKLTPTIYDLLVTQMRGTNRVLIDDCLWIPPRPGLELIRLVRSSDHMVNAQEEMVTTPNSNLRLRRALREMSFSPSRTVIDVPSGWGIIPCNAILAADLIVIPISCDLLAVHCAIDTLKHIRRECHKCNLQMPIVRILLTSYRKTKNAQDVAALCAETWPELVLSTRIRHTEKLKELLLDRLTVFEAPKRATGTGQEDFLSLGEEIDALLDR